MLDLERFVAGVHEYIGKALQPFATRLKALEDREPIPGPQGEKGEPGERGADGAAGMDAQVTADQVREQVCAILKAEPEILNCTVKEWLAANPPAAGKDGRDGIDGKDATVSDEQLVRAVGVHISANPIPAGRDGRDGLPGTPGTKGADGKDGTNGRDGLGFDDLQVEHDGEGLVTFRFAREGVSKDFQIRFPCFADRGVFKEGANYREGHGVTWGGSYFLAQKDAPQGKPGESDDWRLAVKRGRDARVKP